VSVVRKSIGFIVDDVSSLNASIDSSLYLAEQALYQYDVYLIEAHQISCVSGDRQDATLSSSAFKIESFKQSCSFVIEHDVGVDDVLSMAKIDKMDLSSLDIIMMRKDPPVDQLYIGLTYMLDILEDSGVKVINSPKALRDINEKHVILNFPNLITATCVTSCVDSVTEFLIEHRRIVLKPMNEMGGHGICLLDIAVDDMDDCLAVILSMLQKYSMIMAQKCLDVDREGDKRIILINGEPVPYALARFPSSGKFIANLCAGGSGSVVPLTARDYEICGDLKPFVNSHNLSLVGIDVIDGFLTEINITSPTCLRHINSSHLIPVNSLFDC